MITNQDIELAYKDCADAEMQVLRAENNYRKAHAQVLKARQTLIACKEHIRYIHEDINAPIEPYEDRPDLVQVIA